jgi:DNA-binding winged helix-turn-helix (wHTH) protein
MSTNRWLFRFGDFELDAAAYELRRKGRRLRLARQPMDLLLLLVEHPRALVSHEEIAKPCGSRACSSTWMRASIRPS